MSDYYVGEIRLFPFTRGAPIDWHICDGSLLSISQYEVLYNLIGTTYGGNGATNFALPDLRGRVPIHQGTGNSLSTYVLAQIGGTEQVTVSSSQMGNHFHNPQASTLASNKTTASGNVLASIVASPADPFYLTTTVGGSPSNFPNTTIGPAGGNLPHDNTAPTLTLQYCIALFGVYPTQS